MDGAPAVIAAFNTAAYPTIGVARTFATSDGSRVLVGWSLYPYPLGPTYAAFVSVDGVPSAGTPMLLGDGCAAALAYDGQDFVAAWYGQTSDYRRVIRSARISATGAVSPV